MSDANSGAIDPTTGSTGHPQTGEPFEHGPEDSHLRLDGKDGRTHANTVADAKRTEAIEKAVEEKKAELQHDPTLLAKSHGNEPSRGAVKDKELVEDDEETIRKMDEAKAQSAEAHKH